MNTRWKCLMNVFYMSTSIYVGLRSSPYWDITIFKIAFERRTFNEDWQWWSNQFRPEKLGIYQWRDCASTFGIHSFSVWCVYVKRIWYWNAIHMRLVVLACASVTLSNKCVTMCIYTIRYNNVVEKNRNWKSFFFSFSNIIISFVL